MKNILNGTIKQLTQTVVLPHDSHQGLKANYVHNGDGPPVILIHGVAGSLRQWDYLIPVLTGSGYRTLAIDLLGHGDSPRLNSKRIKRQGYHIETIYRHFTSWLDGLNLPEPPVIVGHSMGGYLALNYAMHAPERVRGLLLANPYYTPRQLHGLVHLSLRRPLLSQNILRGVPHWGLETAIALGHRNGVILPKDVVSTMAHDFKRFDPRVVYLPNSTQDLTPKLPLISVPTLIIWGEKDLTLDPASFPRLVHGIPDARLFTLPTSGHVPHLTHRETFNQAALAFLKEILPTETPAATRHE